MRILNACIFERKLIFFCLQYYLVVSIWPNQRRRQSVWAPAESEGTLQYTFVHKH